jgi:hypothetical protein
MHMSATRIELEKSDDEPDDRLVLVETVPGGVGQGRWTQGDYLATLGVYHELHCLVSTCSLLTRSDDGQANGMLQRRIYWHFYPNIYFTNMTSEFLEQELAHGSK